ncbi:Pimeloyl-ACP methyl ester carboxylesterase [Amycolatopsis pretoriensis]|uniref:Pimeloyl-ACP methyl ester carboxylesterase n=1 Tax=Amycolatopsis pretoriensis TaxID=218821 RepID=A0A1H5RI72_9PSEU|nr:alpha/beta hydrolase [Amycolatopsis pretoriensis]SEF38053.1 Pimeloyl-ACP methyl ester carboxylesterase [Amycolatopsis pretoriensis]
MGFSSAKRVSTSTLDVAYEQAGRPDGIPVVLLHGFPYDVRAFDEVAPLLTARNALVLAPYLRGFGTTSFRAESAMRSGQQAALGHDLIEFMDALGIGSAVLAGYDWGGRAACVTAALHPERVRGLVTVDGYNIQDIAAANEPSRPEWEQTFWYQFYFHSERGRQGLERNREELCALLWRTWSPTWYGAEEAFPASASSLHNRDFVEVVVHSYRHRYGLVEGDPRYQRAEDLLAEQPRITVPTVMLETGADGLLGPSSSGDRSYFTGPYEHRLLEGVGHNPPQEAPEEFADAVAVFLRREFG